MNDQPINGGGPAFPRTPGTTGGPLKGGAEGMSLRSYFAAKAMEGLLASGYLLGDLAEGGRLAAVARKEIALQADMLALELIDLGSKS